MSAKSTAIPMTSPDGRPWEADSEVEAFELMSQGYTRNDDGKKTPPAEGKKAPASSGSEKTPAT